MKKTLLLTTLLLSFVFSFAQNDIKARIEFEEAEKAFEAEDYETAIKHLDETDKLIGKWSSKVSYLKIQSLFEITNMGNFAAPTMQPLYEEVTKYMAYINKLNPDDVPMEKLKYVYAIEKTLKVLKLYERQSPEFLAAKKEHDNKNYDVAIKLWEKLALKGNSWAMRNLGVIYRDDKNNLNKAKEWYVKAIENGNAVAAYQFADIDTENSRKWHEIAAEMGHPHGVYGKGWYAKNDKNFQKAKEYYEKAAELGSGQANVDLGEMYEKGEGTEKDTKQAFKYYMKAAIKGNSNGMKEVGRAFWYGLGIMKNEYKALEWFNKAADKNNTDALYYLSKVVYTKGGDNVKNDYSKAEQYALKAITLDKGNSYLIGDLYTLPDNENFPKALEYYEKSAEAGRLYSMLKTANLYYSGKGEITKDYKKAAKYYEAYYESQKKNESYIDNLIEIYTRGGNGIEKDKVKAKYWKNIRQTK